MFDDGADAISKRVDNTHEARSIEIFLAAREPGTGQLIAACFNSMYTSKGIPRSGDTAPQVLVDSLDFERMKQEFGVATIMPDEFFDMYERTGPGTMNCKLQFTTDWARG